MSATPKKVIFEEEARDTLKKGVHILADVVKGTLGPKGKNVGLDSGWGAPTITNDGNSIIKDIEIKDPCVNMGISMGKDVAQKTKESSGDGRTTAILLFSDLVELGIKRVVSGVNPINLKRGMEKAVECVLEEIDANATSVSSSKDIENIATVSAAGDLEIGKIIAESIDKVGEKGVITVEEGKGATTTIKLKEGMQFDQGYFSPYFCTSSKPMQVELHNTKILIVNKNITSIQELLPILQPLASINSPLLLIAEGIEGEALTTLIINKLRGTLQVAAVKSPGFGDQRQALLTDLALLTGATVVSEDVGMQLKEATPELLGAAEKVKISKDATTIIGGQGDKENLYVRIKQIEHEYENATNDYDKKKLKERKAKLQDGVAIIQVGAPSEVEMKQKKQRIEDSLNSTLAAQEGGFVLGGGSALLRASRKLSTLKLDGEEQIGVEIVKKACERPCKQIAENCGKNGDLVLEEILAEKPPFGFNALTGKVEDLLAAQVIDPTKVVKTSLQSAISGAGTLIMSEALIVDDSE